MTTLPDKRYATIVADPPWQYEDGTGGTYKNGVLHKVRLPYPTMPLDAIKELPIGDLALPGAHLYLWTTNAYLEAAFDVARAWGFPLFVNVLVWCKPHGTLSGGVFHSNTEFVLFSKARGTAPPTPARIGTRWFQWPRSNVHSRKPEAFLDLVEHVSPGPYLELFARRNRLGWDTWGNESFEHAQIPGQLAIGEEA